MKHLVENEVSLPLCELLLVMADGEVIARDCARRQSRAAENPRAARFLKAQARHEQFHGLLFRRVAAWLEPDLSASKVRSAGLVEYGRRLESAISREEWTDVLVGQQIVLENLGDLVLSELDDEVKQRGGGFQRLRSLILRQEQAHHSFGLRLLSAQLADDRIDQAEIQAIAREYIELADQVLVDVEPLLDAMGANTQAYRRDLPYRLPAWATGMAR